MKFKIGDLVEGTEDNRWVRGYLRGFSGPNNMLLCIEVIEQNGYNTPLHNCRGVIPSGKGWEVSPKNAKHSKNFIVKGIIKDLL